MKIKKTMVEQACQHDVAKTALWLAFYGHATEPDLADGLLKIAQEHHRRCDKKQGLRVGERVYRREASACRAVLIRATKRQAEPDYENTERALDYALDHLEVALGFEEPKPEPTYSAVTIMSDPATQTIQ